MRVRRKSSYKRLANSARNYRWQAILFCIGGAIMLWLLNALNKVYTTYINHPIALIIDDANKKKSQVVPSTLYLEVTGGGWQLLRYLLRFNIKPIELLVMQIPGSKKMQEEYFYRIATKEIKGLKVRGVWINEVLRVHKPSQESPVG